MQSDGEIKFDKVLMWIEKGIVHVWKTFIFRSRITLHWIRNKDENSSSPKEFHTIRIFLFFPPEKRILLFWELVLIKDSEGVWSQVKDTGWSKFGAKTIPGLEGSSHWLLCWQSGSSLRASLPNQDSNIAQCIMDQGPCVHLVHTCIWTPALLLTSWVTCALTSGQPCYLIFLIFGFLIYQTRQLIYISEGCDENRIRSLAQ